MADVPTPGEEANGWTGAELRAYLAERDQAVNAMHRLGAVGSQAPHRVVVIGTGQHDPMDW